MMRLSRALLLRVCSLAPQPRDSKKTGITHVLELVNALQTTGSMVSMLLNQQPFV